MRPPFDIESCWGRINLIVPLAASPVHWYTEGTCAIGAQQRTNRLTQWAGLRGSVEKASGDGLGNGVVDSLNSLAAVARRNVHDLLG